MKNGKLIAFVIACITFIGGLATGNLLNYYNEKKSSASSSVESSAESIENHEENLITSTEENSTVKLLNIMLDTDYKTVKVNDTSYNIIGYIEVNESNKDIIYNGLNINEYNFVYRVDNIKAFVLLDTPVTYVDENNQQHMLESYRWLAYITDGYNEAKLETYAAVGEDGTELTSIIHNYKDGERISYESLIEQGIIEENTHWSVE